METEICFFFPTSAHIAPRPSAELFSHMGILSTFPSTSVTRAAGPAI